MEFKYKENDVPDEALREKFSKMTPEELEVLINQELERLKKQWELDDAKEQAAKKTSTSRNV